MLLNHLAIQTSVAIKARGILLSFLAALILLMGLAIVFQLLRNTSCCSHVQNGWHCRKCLIKQAELSFLACESSLMELFLLSVKLPIEPLLHFKYELLLGAI